VTSEVTEVDRSDDPARRAARRARWKRALDEMAPGPEEQRPP
jgi:hypothetical protein